MGNGIVSDALLGSSVTPVIDIIQAYRHGDFKDMFKEGAKVAAEKAVDKGIEKGAEHTPNVAVTLATTATVVVSTPNASSIASVSSRITARIPTSTMARAGSNALSKFGTLVKTPWDASVTSFSALVCAMNY